MVEKYHDNVLVQIREIYGEKIPLLVNYYRLKLYKKSLSRVEFIDPISRELNMFESIKYSNPFNL